MKEYLPETASQTARPMFISVWRLTPRVFIFLRKTLARSLTTADTTGERITIEGRVIDGSGTPV